MKIVFAAIPAYGHLYPLMPLALACVEGGHEVTVAAGPPFLDRLPLPTIPQQPPELDLDAAFRETQRRNPGLHGAELMVGLFADVTAEAVAGVLLPTLEESRPDLVIYEAMDAGCWGRGQRVADPVRGVRHLAERHGSRDGPSRDGPLPTRPLGGPRPPASGGQPAAQRVPAGPHPRRRSAGSPARSP